MLETSKADYRHKRLQVIHDQEIQERGFKGWSSAFSNMEFIDNSKLDGILDFLGKFFIHELAKADPTWGVKKMQTFQGMSLML